jgi:small subunit ribosomal protein S29
LDIKCFSCGRCFSKDEWDAILPEGLPAGMMKEFQDTRRCAVMVRESFLDLRDNFRRIVDPAITAKRKGALILLHLGCCSLP